jgi:hypothetical protein
MRRSSIGDRPSSIVHRPSSIVHRRWVSAGLCVLCLACVAPVAAQERFRVSANVGQQASTMTVSQEQPFDRYFEQGTFTFERTVPKGPIFDAGATVRLWHRLHAGAAVSVFDKTGAGTLTARVPHPLQFNKPRTTTGEVPGAARREVGSHFVFGWLIPASNGLDFLLFGGPSIFAAEQLFVRSLPLTLDKEVFPFDELAFPGADTETLRKTVPGYHAGVDMSWRLTRHLGVGLLMRFSSGKTDFTPTGAQPVEVTVGGLHAGGGVRVMF